jgi:hypothetical protein
MPLRIVVSGLIAQYPLGGVAWDYVQYPAGLKLLGHDVLYLEDTGLWPYNPTEGGVSKSCDFNVEYLTDVMARFGLEDRWAYRFPWESRWFGLSDRMRKEVLETADVLINVSGTLQHLEEYRQIPVLVYIDSDPVFTQIKVAKGQSSLLRSLELHDVHFSFGERVRERWPDSPVDWQPTRQPVLLDDWMGDTSPRDAFTTVMNWTSYKPIEHEGRAYGQKDMEFMRFIDLPTAVDPVLEIAVNEGKTRVTPREFLAHRGWRVVDPDVMCPDLESYREYIQGSAAEWSVAKNGYVEGKPGWFSCRSACYLAAGRPVVVQDTGFEGILPTGEGLLSFRTIEEAAEGIREVAGDYERHGRAAREIAGEFFEARQVLGSLLERAATTVGRGHKPTEFPSMSGAGSKPNAGGGRL